jgi:hypothetical protein
MLTIKCYHLAGWSLSSWAARVAAAASCARGAQVVIRDVVSGNAFNFHCITPIMRGPHRIYNEFSLRDPFPRCVRARNLHFCISLASLQRRVHPVMLLPRIPAANKRNYSESQSRRNRERERLLRLFIDV